MVTSLRTQRRGALDAKSAKQTNYVQCVITDNLLLFSPAKCAQRQHFCGGFNIFTELLRAKIVFGISPGTGAGALFDNTLKPFCVVLALSVGVI